MNYLRRLKELLARGNKWKVRCASWQEAIDNHGATYNEDAFFHRLTDSASKVKSGEAIFERDTVLFQSKLYSWQLISSLLYVYSIENKLSVIDFGGGLGSTFNQAKDFIKDLNWFIVEQSRVVEIGNQEFSTDKLKFINSIDEAPEAINIMLFSSVLQYLENPYDILRDAFEHQFDYLLIDRTFFSNDSIEKIMIQEVPPSIYKAKIPCHFFSEAKFKDIIENHFEILFEWELGEERNSVKYEKGMLCKRKRYNAQAVTQ